MSSHRESDTSGDDQKRKREESFEVFKKSRKTNRSPHTEQTTSEMDSIKDMMKEILGEIKGMRQEFKEEVKQLKKENENLYKKITSLENRVRMIENENRKDNIVIKGLTTKKQGQLQCEDIENFIANKLKTNVKILSVTEIKQKTDQQMVVVKCESFEQKRQIMRNKNKLKGTECYLEDDLTKEDRKIQTILRHKVKEERSKGKNVKMGYRKIVINNEIWDWNEEENNIVKRQSKN